MKRQAAAWTATLLLHAAALFWIALEPPARHPAELPVVLVQLLPAAPPETSVAPRVQPSAPAIQAPTRHPPFPPPKITFSGPPVSPAAIPERGAAHAEIPPPSPAPVPDGTENSASAPQLAGPPLPAETIPEPASAQLPGQESGKGRSESSRHAATAAYIPAEYAARNRKPVYPLLSRRYGEEGTVILRVLVKPDGTAGKVEIQSSSGYPLLDSAAKNAVHNWRFSPATRNGQPVADWFLIPIPFTLND